MTRPSKKFETLKAEEISLQSFYMYQVARLLTQWENLDNSNVAKKVFFRNATKFDCQMRK